MAWWDHDRDDGGQAKPGLRARLRSVWDKRARPEDPAGKEILRDANGEPTLVVGRGQPLGVRATDGSVIPFPEEEVAHWLRRDWRDEEKLELGRTGAWKYAPRPTSHVDHEGWRIEADEVDAMSGAPLNGHKSDTRSVALATPGTARGAPSHHVSPAPTDKGFLPPPPPAACVP